MIPSVDMNMNYECCAGAGASIHRRSNENGKWYSYLNLSLPRFQFFKQRPDIILTSRCGKDLIWREIIVSACVVACQLHYHTLSSTIRLLLSLLVPYLDGNDVVLLVMIMAANEDDLYGDLEDAVANPVPPNKKSTNTKSGEPSSSTMMPEPEIQLLLEQLKQIKAENDILKRNMGILYRTAKSELERKDRAIFQLQNELDSLRR